jgi:DivIVA domain-containing protein
MDITPQVINEVEFHQRMRGYDPDEVDDFLERVAVAVSRLHDELVQARGRIAAAEQRAADAERHAREAADRGSASAPRAKHDAVPERAVSDVPAATTAASADATATAAQAEFETLKRTLVLAQRTADAAIREADVEAAHTTAAAQERADGLLAEASNEAHRIVRTAEQDARKAQEDTRLRLIKEVGALESARDALKGDVGTFERHIDEQRTRLRGTVTELQRLLDDPGRLRGPAVPNASEVSLPASVRRDDPAPAGAAASRTGPSGSSTPRPAAPRPSAAPERQATTPAAPRSRPDVQAPRASDRGPGPGAIRSAAPGGSGVGEEVDEGAWARFAGGDDGPPAEPVARTAPAGDDDSYLSELRKAMLDDTTAPGVDPGGLDDADEGGRGRFGRRRP